MKDSGSPGRHMELGDPRQMGVDHVLKWFAWARVPPLGDPSDVLGTRRGGLAAINKPTWVGDGRLATNRAERQPKASPELELVGRVQKFARDQLRADERGATNPLGAICDTLKSLHP